MVLKKEEVAAVVLVRVRLLLILLLVLGLLVIAVSFTYRRLAGSVVSCCLSASSGNVSKTPKAAATHEL